MRATVTPLDGPAGQRRFAQVVAANVRAEVARRSIARHDIAEALGITPQAVSHKLTGRRPITLDELAALADLLGVSITTLVLEEDDGGPAPRVYGERGRGVVRHQGLEPRTRWLMPSGEGQDGPVPSYPASAA